MFSFPVVSGPVVISDLQSFGVYDILPEESISLLGAPWIALFAVGFEVSTEHGAAVRNESLRA